MILGLGIDVCSVKRMETAVDRFGQRFLNRVFTQREQNYAVRSIPRLGLRYSQMFAAKEAMSKALGTGMREGISWQHIEVGHNALGAPHLTLTHKALEHLLCLAAGKKTHIHVSLSSEDSLVQAMVLIDATPV